MSFRDHAESLLLGGLLALAGCIAPVDADGDGWTVEDGDCDDNSAAIHPATHEVCDGLDTDCNGEVEDHLDADGDGWSICTGDCDDNAEGLNCDWIDIVASGNNACVLADSGGGICWGQRGDQGFNGPYASLHGGCCASNATALDDVGNLWSMQSGSLLWDAEIELVAATGGWGGLCVLDTDGRAECNEGVPVATSSLAPETFLDIDLGDHIFCGIREDSTLLCFSDSEAIGVEAVPPEGGGYVDMETGSAHGCALHEDGHIDCWPSDWEESPDGSFVALASERYASCGIREGSGEVVCWDTLGIQSAPDGPFRQIASGSNFSCGLRPSGQIECWGSPFVQDVPE